MSEIQLIEGVLKQAARRRRLERLWQGAWQGLLLGGSLWLLMFGAYKLFPVPTLWLWIVGGVAGLIFATMTIIGGWRKNTLLETARWADRKKQLQERLSTALEVSGSPGTGEWKNLILNDAARHAQEFDAKQALPFRFPVVGRWALLIALLSCALGFVPPYRSSSYVAKQNEVANVKETGKKLAEFVKRTAEHRQPVLEPTQKALDTVQETGLKLAKANLTRSEALRDLAKLTDKLSEQNRELEKNPGLKALERAAREKETGPGSGKTSDAIQKQIDSLQKSLGEAAGKEDNLDKLKDKMDKARDAVGKLPDKNTPEGKAAREQLAQALSEMSREASSMGQSLDGLDDAIKALQNNQTDMAIKDMQAAMNDLNKLRDMTKALKQMQDQQAAQMGKDLAEQLKNGQAQAAQDTLEKMVKQLKDSNLSSEQCDKIAEEVSKAIKPGSKYGKVGESLQKAIKQMSDAKKSGKGSPQGQQSQSEAAQSLADAADELKKLQQQMADAEAMQDALDAVERAQKAIASGKGWKDSMGKPCGSCNGEGCAECKGRGWGKGGRPGGGVGTWADEDGWSYFPDKMRPVDNSGVVRPDQDPRGHTERGDAELNPDLAPTKVRGKISQGGPMPSITLKGVSIKGQSSVQYEEAAAAAQSDAQNALNQDQVPRAYRNSVKGYFDDLKK